MAKISERLLAPTSNLTRSPNSAAELHKICSAITHMYRIGFIGGIARNKNFSVILASEQITLKAAANRISWRPRARGLMLVSFGVEMASEQRAVCSEDYDG
jgi:hypothetical protein